MTESPPRLRIFEKVGLRISISARDPDERLPGIAAWRVDTCRDDSSELASSYWVQGRVFYLCSVELASAASDGPSYSINGPGIECIPRKVVLFGPRSPNTRRNESRTLKRRTADVYDRRLSPTS
jgi:hypothetical protein